MPQHVQSTLALCPPWLLGPDGSRYMTVFGDAENQLETKAHDAATAHMPGQADASAIPLQAADRRLVQGPAETDQQFAARLSGALDAWARAGSRHAILSQVHTYLAGLNPDVDPALPEARIVGGNGTYTIWDTYLVGAAQDAAPAHQTVTPENWDWDHVFQPWRAWLAVFLSLASTPVLSGTAATAASAGGSGVSGVTTGFVTLTGLAGLTGAQVQQYLSIGFYTGTAVNSVNGGTYQIAAVLSATSCIIAAPSATVPDPGGTVEWTINAYPYIKPTPVCGAPSAVCGAGSMGVVMANGSSAENAVTSIRNLLLTWKSASAYYPNILFSFGGLAINGEFAPGSASGTGNPTGNWGSYGHLVGGVWVRARVPLNPFTSFAIGTGRRFQCTQENIT